MTQINDVRFNALVGPTPGEQAVARYSVAGYPLDVTRVNGVGDIPTYSAYETFYYGEEAALVRLVDSLNEIGALDSLQWLYPLCFNNIQAAQLDCIGGVDKNGSGWISPGTDTIASMHDNDGFTLDSTKGTNGTASYQGIWMGDFRETPTGILPRNYFFGFYNRIQLVNTPGITGSSQTVFSSNIDDTRFYQYRNRAGIPGIQVDYSTKTRSLSQISNTQWPLRVNTLYTFGLSDLEEVIYFDNIRNLDEVNVDYVDITADNTLLGGAVNGVGDVSEQFDMTVSLLMGGAVGEISPGEKATQFEREIDRFLFNLGVTNVLEPIPFQGSMIL